MAKRKNTKGVFRIRINKSYIMLKLYIYTNLQRAL
jgi:hypothetical protein